MKGCTYQQLPLLNSQLFTVVQRHAESASHGFETEAEYIEAAQQRLHDFADDRSDAYAGIRFLNMQRSDATAAQAVMEKIVDDLVKLMGDDELGHVWAAWHPHRFAAVAAYVYLSLPIPQRRLRNGIGWLTPKGSTSR